MHTLTTPCRGNLVRIFSLPNVTAETFLKNLALLGTRPVSRRVLHAKCTRQTIGHLLASANGQTPRCPYRNARMRRVEKWDQVQFVYSKIRVTSNNRVSHSRIREVTFHLYLRSDRILSNWFRSLERVLDQLWSSAQREGKWDCLIRDEGQQERMFTRGACNDERTIRWLFERRLICYTWALDT